MCKFSPNFDGKKIRHCQFVFCYSLILIELIEHDILVINAPNSCTEIATLTVKFSA